ncbi:unnamed protein product [Phaedon cochleariae]|uniref:Major facilitator superfamily (MFS) profile domain-containing protein n=1 Tax=Phaedon cochleariae TaxID=80249 RepID=A0A9P0GUH5_PHACE|nr:unnamed protein product [Phaedon cochleariae]
MIKMKSIVDLSMFKSRIFQYLAAFGANMGMVSLGMHYGWSSTSIPRLQSVNSTIQITSDEGSWLASVTPLGAIVGTILVALTLNSVGYKKFIILISLPLTLSWLLIALANNKVYFFIGRIIAGIMDGILFTVIPPFLSEISDPDIRGFMGITYLLALVIGMLLINVLFLCVSDVTTAAIASVLSLPILLIIPWLPDSPYFLLMKQDTLAAEASLRKYRGKSDVVEEIDRITKSLMQNSDEGRFIDLVRNKFHRKSLLLAMGLIIFQHLSGIMAIQSYCETVFIESSSFLNPTISNLIYFIVYFFATVLSQFLVDIFGRRLLLLSSTGLVIAMLLLNGTYLYIKNWTTIDTTSFDFLQLVAILIYILTFSIGLNTVPTLIASEIFTPNIKGVAFCVINICYSLISTVVIKFFIWSKDTFGMFVPFYIFAICSMLGMGFSAMFMPETKNKTLEKIQMEIRGQKE